MFDWRAWRWTRLSGSRSAAAAPIALEYKVFDKIRRSYPLMIVSSIDTGLPLLRMLALTHIVSLTEACFVSSGVAILAACYSGGIILLANAVVPLVFGPKFRVSHSEMILLGAAAFVRLVRTEPFTALMLNLGRTRRLAPSSVLASSSLAYMVLFSFFDRSLTAVLAARLLGELTSAGVAFVMGRSVAEGGRVIFSFSTLFGALCVGAAGVASMALERTGASWALLLAASAAYAIVMLLWAALDLRHRMTRLRAAMASGPKPESARPGS